MELPAKPHDALFRRVFGQALNAATLLRSVLPEEIAERLDLEKLHRVNASHVDARLGLSESDIVFCTPVKGHMTLVYFLMEHQSRTDYAMPYRNYHYVGQLWDALTPCMKKTKKDSKLPLIIPIVVYHNKRQRWSAATDIAELIDLDTDTAEAFAATGIIPRLWFFLDDLSLLSEEGIAARPLTPAAHIATLLLAFAAGHSNVTELFTPWSDELRAIADEPDGPIEPDGLDTLTTIVVYIGCVTNTKAEQLQTFFTRISPRAKEIYMTTFDMVRAEGRADTLLVQLTTKFGTLSDQVVNTVKSATDEQLLRWTKQVLDAKSLDEALA